MGGIEGGAFSSASPDGIPAPSKTKREAESLAENPTRFPACSRRHPNTDGVWIFLPGGKTASRSPAHRFPVSTSPEPFHIENQHLPIGSHRGLIHRSLLRPLALRASRATQCSNPLKSQSKRLLAKEIRSKRQRRRTKPRCTPYLLVVLMSK